jgi:hypothetical protein
MFEYMNAVGQRRLDSIIASYVENNYCAPREFKYNVGHGRNRKALTLEECRKIYHYLQTTAKVHGLDIPGRMPGTSK